MAGKLSKHNQGPFSLCHDAFLHSNIMVDEKGFNVTGVINWEGACTVGRELIAFPECLAAMPALFALPQRYDSDGQPLDKELRQAWRERREYVKMAKMAEDREYALLVPRHRQVTVAAFGGARCRL